MKSKPSLPSMNAKKEVKEQTHQKEEKKGKQNSIIKKLQLKNKFIKVVSNQPKKLMKMVKGNSFVSKNITIASGSPRLLVPKIPIKHLYEQIGKSATVSTLNQHDFSKSPFYDQKSNQNKNLMEMAPSVSAQRFVELSQQVTSNMQHFHKKFSQLSKQDEGKLLDLQTQKCYKHIPKQYFEQQQYSQDFIEKILTRNRQQVEEKIYDLGDYRDQVEYNINQQVNYKMKLFMDFAVYLKGIGEMVDVSVMKIKCSRHKNKILKDITVQKSNNINGLRDRQNHLKETIEILKQMKKIKALEKSLMSMINAKNKTHITTLYENYCRQHLEIKDFCCGRNLCCFGDIRYYVERSYHETFNKSLQKYEISQLIVRFSYIGELAYLSQDSLSQVLKPKKGTYMLAPFESHKNFDNTRHQGRQVPGGKNSHQRDVKQQKQCQSLSSLQFIGSSAEKLNLNAKLQNEKHESSLKPTSQAILDESIEAESPYHSQQFQLIIKESIQNQIIHIFELGLERCVYSTDNICQHMKEAFRKMQLTFYRTLLENTSKPKEDLLDELINFTLNKPNQNELHQNLMVQSGVESRQLKKYEKAEIINKIPLGKYVALCKVYSGRFLKIAKRLLSVLNELFKVMDRVKIKGQTEGSKDKRINKSDFNDDFGGAVQAESILTDEKQEVITAYLMQLLLILMNFVDQSVSCLVGLRQYKQTEGSIADGLIALCKDWQNIVFEWQRKYEQNFWRRFILHLEDPTNDNQQINCSPTKIRQKQQQSFNGLESFKDLESFVRDQNDNESCEDVSEEAMSRQQVVLKLLPNLTYVKNLKIHTNFNFLCKNVLSKELIKRIESENWSPIAMHQQIQSDVGYLIYGRLYSQKEEKQEDSRNFLSKSLLLDRSHLGQTARKSEEEIPQQQQTQHIDFEIEMTKSYIQLKDKIFCLTGVTHYVIEILHMFFVYYDELNVLGLVEQAGNGRGESRVKKKEEIYEKMFDGERVTQDLLLKKSIDILWMLANRIKYYVANLKELHKKVKNYARFLLVGFVQVRFYKNLIEMICSEGECDRFTVPGLMEGSLSKEAQARTKQFGCEMDNIMSEIVKKYNSILNEKIKESIKKLEINPKKQIVVPSGATQEILTQLSQSFSAICDIVIEEKVFWQFMNSSWIKGYLQKINEQQNSLKKYVTKASGSVSGGKKIEEINWQMKLEWKYYELSFLLMQMEADKYKEYIKDIEVVEDEIKKSKQMQH